MQQNSLGFQQPVSREVVNLLAIKRIQPLESIVLCFEMLKLERKMVAVGEWGEVLTGSLRFMEKWLSDQLRRQVMETKTNRVVFQISSIWQPLSFLPSSILSEVKTSRTRYHHADWLSIELLFCRRSRWENQGMKITPRTIRRKANHFADKNSFLGWISFFNWTSPRLSNAVQGMSLFYFQLNLHCQWHVLTTLEEDADLYITQCGAMSGLRQHLPRCPHVQSQIQRQYWVRIPAKLQDPAKYLQSTPRSQKIENWPEYSYLHSSWNWSPCQRRAAHQMQDAR